MARWIHLSLGILWILLCIPGLIWWRDQVWFVVAMSLYANIEASFAAFFAAKSNRKDQDGE